MYVKLIPWFIQSPCIIPNESPWQQAWPAAFEYIFILKVRRSETGQAEQWQCCSWSPWKCLSYCVLETSLECRKKIYNWNVKLLHLQFVLAKISHAIPTTMPSTEALSYSRNSLEIKPKFSSFLLHLEGSSSQSWHSTAARALCTSTELSQVFTFAKCSSLLLPPLEL